MGYGVRFFFNFRALLVNLSIFYFTFFLKFVLQFFSLMLE